MPEVSQPLLGFDDPAHHQGKTPESRIASYSGAVYALETRGVRTKQYLELLRTKGPLTDHKAAEFMHVGLSSINSIRGTVIERAEDAGLPAPIVVGGEERIPRGVRGKATWRTKWRLA